MVRCSRCGEQAPEGAVVCRACGNKLGALRAIPRSAPRESRMKERSPGTVAAFGLFTLGIYWVFWYYSVCRQLVELRQSNMRPGLCALIFFLTITPVGFWFVSAAIVQLLAVSFSLGPEGVAIVQLVYSLSMLGLGTYLLSSAAKGVQALHSATGSSSGFKHSVPYALASQFGPFVIPFFTARLQSELNRYQKVRDVSADGAASREKLEMLRPFPLPRLAIAFAIGAIVLAEVFLLSAIAIPQYTVFRTRSYNAAAQSDLINGKRCVEAYYADHGTYPASLEQVASCKRTSHEVHLVYEKLTQREYRITSSHLHGDKEYRCSSGETTVYWRDKKNLNNVWQPK